MTRNFCFLLACLFGFTAAMAQKKTQLLDSATNNPFVSDTAISSGKKKVISIETYAQRYNPRKALFYSAILPGAGQAYNGKYWKVPLVYGGFAFGIFMVKNYQEQYLYAKDQLFQILND
ncbi:MAG TPA: DUF5683 domain-containing protein, partial [Cyclobacteriaceae bacterium]|nr:DUF5683 domain-containing protein [Cyclobacteriaceae bacterium]